MVDDSRTVWCGNLSDRVSQTLLHELFLQAGPVQRTFIPKDQDGRQRNYAFITFVHEESVEYAMNIFEGTTLFDRTLRLQFRQGPRINNGSIREGEAILSGKSGSPYHNNDGIKLSESLVNRFEKMTQQTHIAFDSYKRDQQVKQIDDSNDASHRSRMKDLSIASLTGQWSSKSNFAPERFEPYKNEYRHNKYKEMERNHGRGKYDKFDNDHKQRDHNHKNQIKDYHRRREYDHKSRPRY